ncbi:Uncharacterized conserved protein, DUF2252 family [Gracilibacillus ureilyticus]|uniref:Uncharacterized conserved protein, DUF2252 family n=1 Tax=Gracilibacillus ureilyticus TaxID=531814 RepID=A0A1H9QTN3_9BACI|nr:DUF2252 family protein [Gracilibacillus ureilyticus]SER63826.1 Uncharacterized conserved protein, DUF2252 family [Gracilibacillus ureilyticus]
MVLDIQEKVRETNRNLRKQSLHTILEQLDDYVMGLSKQERRRKYDKMKQNPYSFYRGSAYLFYYDVTKIPFAFHTEKSMPTWIMGDMHFDNFSSFQDEDGQLVFDVDDFDEGYLGSYLYDLLRMVVSIRLMTQQHGITDSTIRDELVTAFLKAYCKQISKFANREEDPRTTSFTVENTKGPIKKVLKKLEERQATHELDKQTIINNDGERVFNREKEKLHEVTQKEFRDITANWNKYIDSIPKEWKREDSHYQIKDIVKKLGSGVASTGLKRYYVLIEGIDEHAANDDIILEVKEARPAIPAYFVEYNESFWEQYKHQGKRVIHTQKAMHHKADEYLGYLTIGNREFYVRERCAFDKDINPKHLDDVKPIKQTVKTMGKIAAKIHARADQDINEELLGYHSEDAIYDVIERDRNQFIQELVSWSRFYKHQVERDYTIFLEWLETDFYPNA